MHNIFVYILDSYKINQSLKKSSYKTIGDLSKALGLHRNTISNYLCGQPIVSDSLDKMLGALQLKLPDVITEIKTKTEPDYAPVASLCDKLILMNPKICVVLFGSRSRGTERKYSDWDIGVYAQNGLAHGDYLKMLNAKNDWEEESPYFADVVNLNNADENFLAKISKHWQFLGGSLASWLSLNKK